MKTAQALPAVCETGITLDYASGEARIDTTVREVATELRRKGFRERKDGQCFPYRRFVGDIEQVGFFSPGKGDPAQSAVIGQRRPHELQESAKAVRDPRKREN